MTTMTKTDAIATIKELKQKIFILGGEVSDKTIESCVYMVDEMAVVPCVRMIVNDELYGSGITFDYNEKYGLSVEITVTDNGMHGYVNYNDEESSSFKFDSVEEAVNFWNVIVGKVAKG